ncbi:MAG: nucleotide-binding protein [Burkholderiaceae bacterium]|nr:nucleotide-binding protein [Burkholderiaceae bacterium]
MARVPIEILSNGKSPTEWLTAAVQLANAEQVEFDFCMADEKMDSHVRMHSYVRANASEFLDSLESLREHNRGYHPFMILATDAELDGEKLSNLFASARADKGVAVVTTYLVPDVIVPADRMPAYFIYYMARYALSFLAPQHGNHEASKDCIFDRKIQKKDILKSMKAQSFCDDCRRELLSGAGTFSSDQFAAISKLLALSGRILNEGHEKDGRSRIFVGSSTEGLKIANKLQELLSPELSVVVWNQNTVFGLGDSTLEALEAAILEYQYGVFVFTPDDQLYTRGATLSVARDNVIFELGMFIGKLGRRRAFVIHPSKKSVSLPSDLNGITTAPYEATESNLASALGPVASKVREAVYRS